MTAETFDPSEGAGAESLPSVPFRIRVGVTGHRRLPDGVDWRGRVIAALHEAEKHLGLPPTQPEPTAPKPSPAPGSPVDTPVVFTVVSALAEGADRIVAGFFLELSGTELEVPLPLASSDYLKDFDTEASRKEFSHLLRQASAVIRAPHHETRDEGYEWAGQTMVFHSDFVIALWDGQPSRGRGGTAEAVDFARRHGRAVVRVPTDVGEPIELLAPIVDSTRPDPRAVPWYLKVLAYQLPRQRRPEPFAHLAESLRGIQAHNRAVIHPAVLAKAVAKGRHDLMEALHGSPRALEIWTPIALWLLPFYVRADHLALAAQRPFKRVVRLVYLMPVAAIATVAIQLQYYPHDAGLLGIEVVLLLGVLVLLGLERQNGWHQQWLSCRHLAERCRGGFFLAALEEPVPHAHTIPAGSYLDEEEDLSLAPPSGTRIRAFHEQSPSWVPRLFEEIWRHRPPTLATEADTRLLRHIIASGWVTEQAEYHAKVAVRQGALSRATNRVTILLFLATVAVALLHAVNAFASHATIDQLLGTLAIILPALAAALLALSRQEEYRRHQESSALMSRRLTAAAAIVEKAPTLSILRADAEAADDLIMEENRDWFGVMRRRQPEPS